MSLATKFRVLKSGNNSFSIEVKEGDGEWSCTETVTSTLEEALKMIECVKEMLASSEPEVVWEEK